MKILSVVYYQSFIDVDYTADIGYNNKIVSDNDSMHVDDYWK